PTLIDATSGTVTYTFPVPADAAPNQQFNDTITLTDAANNVGTFGVTISTAPEGPGPGSGRIEIEQALVIACQSAPAGSDLAATCAALPAEGTAERAAADSQVKPDELAAQGTMAIEAADGQSQLVGSRLSALRAGSSGLSLSGLNLNLFGQHVPGFVLDSMLPRVGQSGDQSGISTKFGFFVNGNVRIGDKDPSANEPGFDFDAYDATMGLDYRFTPNFVFGGALGYGTAETDFQNDAGDTELDGYKLSFYGTYYTSQAVYVDGIFTFGMNSYDTRRRITFTGVNEDAMGDTDGTEISLSVGGGYDFTRDGFVFGPYGRASYLQLDIDGYRETLTGNTGLALQLDDQEATSITATVGGKAIYNISTTIGVLSPQLNVEYEYEFDDDQRAITGVFVSDPTATQWGFGIDEPDRDVINVGVGGSATLKNGTSGFLFYEQLLGHDDISQFTVTGGFRFEF
ncbi:MAG: autotransporter outer membrane beta-barrel domain-containing protein, partial [Gammaproteobacteria bacterium]